ncbi:unnamed protein product [Gongylonema pulchrum]|uniref:Uncharacterized protein n=1 Tax=Gongylonema pulchrum TaxID=637853 RepID=A0A183CVG9_9BILA|nr:unnamed protein product [Gongylonema pulchrum]
MKTYLFQWGGCLPPYHKYGVFLLCGFELFVSSLSMAVAQKYYELCTILFPISIYMFDDTKQKQIPGFVWTDRERNILHRQKLLLLWCTSTLTVFLSMALIMPYFFSFSIRRIRLLIMYILALVFACAVAVNGAVLVWLYITAPADNKLFYDLFDSSVKEEIYLTEIEKQLDCISDDDKELDPTVKWLKPLLIIWIVGHVLTAFLFGFANKGLPCLKN